MVLKLLKFNFGFKKIPQIYDMILKPLTHFI